MLRAPRQERAKEEGRGRAERAIAVDERYTPGASPWPACCWPSSARATRSRSSSGSPDRSQRPALHAGERARRAGGSTRRSHPRAGDQGDATAASSAWPGAPHIKRGASTTRCACSPRWSPPIRARCSRDFLLGWPRRQHDTVEAIKQFDQVIQINPKARRTTTRARDARRGDLDAPGRSYHRPSSSPPLKGIRIELAAVPAEARRRRWGADRRAQGSAREEPGRRRRNALARAYVSRTAREAEAGPPDLEVRPTFVPANLPWGLFAAAGQESGRAATTSRRRRSRAQNLQPTAARDYTAQGNVDGASSTSTGDGSARSTRT